MPKNCAGALPQTAEFLRADLGGELGETRVPAGC
jgi:hypothetical protein